MAARETCMQMNLQCNIAHNPNNSFQLCPTQRSVAHLLPSPVWSNLFLLNYSFATCSVLERGGSWHSGWLIARLNVRFMTPAESETTTHTVQVMTKL